MLTIKCEKCGYEGSFEELVLEDFDSEEMGYCQKCGGKGYPVEEKSTRLG